VLLIVEARFTMVIGGIAGSAKPDALLEAVYEFSLAGLTYLLSIHRSHLSQRQSGLHSCFSVQYRQNDWMPQLLGRGGGFGA